MNEDLQEFYSEYLQEIVSTADSEGDFHDAAFVENMAEFLVDQGYLEEYSYIGFVKKAQGIKADAWNFNETNGVLTLLVADFRLSADVPTITETEVDKDLKRLEKFWAYSQKKDFVDALEESTPAYSLIYQLTKERLAVKRLQLILITNALLSGRMSDSVLSARKNAETELPTSYEIWDIGRLHTIKSSSKVREDIVIDCTEVSPNGIPCLQGAPVECGDYQVILMIMPGEFLADLYDRHGERLLEQNVRTFLQFRGKINKGIKSTILREPHMFIAYNNGLTVTAEKVTLSSDNTHLLSITNLQIVNGGQTTASLFTTRSQEGNDKLKNVFVQVKLTVIPENKIEEVVPLISEYANTQNKINPADFFSNHPFHLRIQELSRRCIANPISGNLRGTYWYYERTRGQYNNNMSRLNASELRKFKINNPKNQMFTKTDLAKYMLSWDKSPEIVSLGAQKCFSQFANEITGKWNDNADQFDEHFYFDLIAKAIIFRYLDSEIKKRTWYGGFKANIVTYTIAKFKDYLDKNQRTIDLIDIWKKQDIAEEIKKMLLTIAEKVNQCIKETPSSTTNITEWCKKQECWEKVRAISLSNEYTNISVFRSQNITTEAEMAPKHMSISAMRTHVETLGTAYWQRLKKWIDESNYSSRFRSMHHQILELACSGQQLSDRQCNVLIKYIEMPMKQTGFK